MKFHISLAVTAAYANTAMPDTRRTAVAMFAHVNHGSRSIAGDHRTRGAGSHRIMRGGDARRRAPI